MMVYRGQLDVGRFEPHLELTGEYRVYRGSVMVQVQWWVDNVARRKWVEVRDGLVPCDDEAREFLQVASAAQRLLSTGENGDASYSGPLADWMRERG